MLFRPSVKELDKVDEPRGTPPLQFSNHILQDSDEPDLPPTYDYADWPKIEHPPAVHIDPGKLTKGNSELRGFEAKILRFLTPELGGLRPNF
jgi:hypothetical protein